MKSKQLTILLLVAVVLGGAAFLLSRKKNGGWSESGEEAGKKVVEFPLNDVAAIAIQSGTGKLTLERKNDIWVVKDRADYPANFTQLSGFLLKLKDLKVNQSVKVGPSQYARLELIDPGQGDTPPPGAGTKVQLMDKDGKALAGILLGKKYMKTADSGFGESEFPAGRYVMATGGTKVALVTDTFDDIEPKPESWLAHDFVKVENPVAVTLAGQTDAQKWKVTRENATAAWKLEGLAEGEAADPNKISTVGAAFSNLGFADVMNPDAKPEETGLDKPTVITVETADHFKYVFKVGKVIGANQPVTVEVSADFPKERTPGKDEKPEDKTKLDDEFKAKLKEHEDKLAAEKKFEGRPYLIAKSTLDQVIKDRSALLMEKKPEGTPLPPGTPGTPGAPGVAPGGVGFPPGAGLPKNHPPITVTTPPVSVPPLNAPGETNPAATPGTEKKSGTGPVAPPKTPVTATTPPVSVPAETAPKPAANKPESPAKPEDKAGNKSESPKPEPAKPDKKPGASE